MMTVPQALDDLACTNLPEPAREYPGKQPDQSGLPSAASPPNLLRTLPGRAAASLLRRSLFRS